ncbi:hypothetical protein D8M05_02145 [Oceanobacillus bengalensis]|uniref:Uncharacterized protein n=1 Tax=Oceanobacillus bengalensis TaxID=1435466 RepID=A0A494Z6M0_9BACI|nr:hypothetical protein D8M05_02145 [Oceanobacillus bengalensis]
MFPPLGLHYSILQYDYCIMMVDCSGGQSTPAGKAHVRRLQKKRSLLLWRLRPCPKVRVLAARSGNQQSTYCAFYINCEVTQLKGEYHKIQRTFQKHIIRE